MEHPIFPQEAVADEYQEPLPEDALPAQDFQIADRGAVNWVLARIAEIQGDLLRDTEIAEEQIKVAQAWLEIRRMRAEARIRRWYEPLEAYARAEIDLETKGAEHSISVPNGALSLRQMPAKWEYDEPALLAWLEANAPDYIRVKREADKAKLKKAAIPSGEQPVLAASGEVIEGVKLVPEPAHFSIRTTAGGKVEVADGAGKAGAEWR